VARDAGYLAGYLRVKHAIESGEATLDELRSGRVSLQALLALRRLRLQGLAHPPRHSPSLAPACLATDLRAASLPAPAPGGALGAAWMPGAALGAAWM